MDWQNATTLQLEDRVTQIDAALEELAHYNLRSGVGSIGFRSKGYPEPEHTEWFQVELGPPTAIDQVVLVPAIWRDNKAGFDSDGFPEQFRILAGTGNPSNATVIASFTAEDQLLPRIAPLVIPCSITATWVRVEASVLGTRQFDKQFDLELAEILIFNGEENVALNKPVTVSVTDHKDAGARQVRFLVDGHLPYIMDAGRGPQSIAFLGSSALDEQPSITLDLGEVYPLNRMHLHSVDSSDTAPQANPSNFAQPRHLIIEGAHRADFSDATPLIEYQQRSIYDAGPILIRQFKETSCRFVRLTALAPYIFPIKGEQRSNLGFAEIELFAKGVNVALNKPASGMSLNTPARSYTALTDGGNLYGHILPTRQWMEELAQRHTLEKERPLLAAELHHRYLRQKVMLRRMTWIAVLLALGIGLTALIDRVVRMRHTALLKKRFAADLHDELGANLHTIGLLSDLSKEFLHSPENLEDVLDRIRVYTERSGAAARYCTDMLEAEGLCEDLVKDIRQSSSRLLSDLDYKVSVSGEALLQELTPRKRIDLFLFNKECLVNILRHSGATKVTIDLAATLNQITLTISDNGYGLQDPAQRVPASLKRRAQLIGSKVTVQQPAEGGTQVILKIQTGRLKRFLGLLSQRSPQHAAAKSKNP